MLDHPARSEIGSRGMSTNVPAPGIAPMLNAFNPATAYMEFWNKSAFELSGEVAQSWLHFVGERWLKDMEFPQQVASCKTADDLSVAVSEFWQQAARDYSTEFNDIASLAWTAMRTTFNGTGLCVSKAGEACGSKFSSRRAGIA
jgi:hypothetical protein